MRANQPFININKGLSKEHKHWLVKLQQYIEKNKSDYPSSIKDLMAICGFSVDFESIRLYNSFHGLLVKQRKNTDEMFKILITDGWFQKYIDEKIPEEQIYDNFISCCLSWGIIPLYYDVDGLYKLIDLESFMMIKTERLRSSCKEIYSKMDVLKNTADVLPNTVSTGINELKGSEHVMPMIKARNELNRFLPEQQEK